VEQYREKVGSFPDVSNSALLPNPGTITTMKMGVNDTKDIQLHKAILNELGYDINLRSTILDFGCGEGKRVCEYRDAGFKAFGVDINLDKDNDFIRLIHNVNGYRIPFEERV
jgi:SAM-dependent methyltransferase